VSVGGRKKGSRGSASLVPEKENEGIFLFFILMITKFKKTLKSDNLTDYTDETTGAVIRKDHTHNFFPIEFFVYAFPELKMKASKFEEMNDAKKYVESHAKKYDNVGTRLWKKIQMKK
jgi:hypothetical protein